MAKSANCVLQFFPMKPSIGQYLRCLREEVGLTRIEAAKRAGIAVSTLWRWEQRKPGPRSRQLMQDYEAMLVGLRKPEDATEGDSIKPSTPLAARSASAAVLLAREEEDSKAVMSVALRSLAARNHLTQSGLAELAHVQQPAVSKWYAAKALPSEENLETIARHLQLTEEETCLLIQCRAVSDSPLWKRFARWNAAPDMEEVFLSNAIDPISERLNEREDLLRLLIAESAARSRAARAQEEEWEKIHIALSCHYALSLMRCQFNREMGRFTHEIRDRYYGHKYRALPDYQKIELMDLLAQRRLERAKGINPHVIVTWSAGFTAENRTWGCGLAAAIAAEQGRVASTVEIIELMDQSIEKSNYLGGSLAVAAGLLCDVGQHKAALAFFEKYWEPHKASRIAGDPYALFPYAIGARIYGANGCKQEAADLIKEGRVELEIIAAAGSQSAACAVAGKLIDSAEAIVED